MNICIDLLDSDYNFANPILNKTWVDNSAVEKTIKVATLLFSIITSIAIGWNNPYSSSYIRNTLATLMIGSIYHGYLSEYFKVDCKTPIITHINSLSAEALRNTSIKDILTATNTEELKDSVKTARDILNRALLNNCNVDLVFHQTILLALSTMKVIIPEEQSQRSVDLFQMSWEEVLQTVPYSRREEGTTTGDDGVKQKTIRVINTPDAGELDYLQKHFEEQKVYYQKYGS